MAERNPNLIPPEAMTSMAQGGTGKPLFSEVFTKVNNAKVKSKYFNKKRNLEYFQIRVVTIKLIFNVNFKKI